MKEKKAPVFARMVLFTLAGFSLIIPIVSIVVYNTLEGGFHAGFLFMLFFFSLIGFYLLRLALWNTYGKEEIYLDGSNVNYIADYGWFKAKPKSVEAEPEMFSHKSVGYEEDYQGALVLGSEKNKIECVTKFPIDQIKAIAKELNETYIPEVK